VVVTRPDGTDQQVVGKNMPAKEIGDQISGCIFDSYILPEVWWSPDNQHLIFEERKYDKNQGKYIDNVYLTEIGTQALNLLMQSVNAAEWINNDELLVQGDNKLYLLSGITQDNIVKKEIPYPPEIDPSPAVYTSSQPDGTIVVSFSEEKISGDFHISREISVWKLVLGPDVTWKKIVDYGKSNWRFPILGARYAVTCDDENNQIIVLNANDLTEVNHLDLPGSTEIDCGTLQVMHEGGDIAYFVAYIGAKPSLFKVALGNDKLEPVLVFDSNQISLEPSETGYYLNYSLENITK
jgi:hypothetical protein